MPLEESRQPFHAPAISGWITGPASLVFRGMVTFKNLLYDWRILPVSRLPKPVISIGNLSMGGTGKSPITMALVESLCQTGLQVAVLSRGYGRKSPKDALWVKADTLAEIGGDEPVMMARRYPSIWVAVGPSRLSAAKVLPGIPDVYLLDDGFQHRQLHRDLDIVLINVSQSLPQWFPKGFFRETLPSLQRADWVVLTHCCNPKEAQAWEERIARQKESLPVAKCRFQPKELKEVGSSRVESLDLLKDLPVAAYAGIANPLPFFQTLQDLGAQLQLRHVLKDHEGFTPEGFRTWLRKAKMQGVRAVITTEKDAVKLDKHEVFDIVVFFLTTGVVWAEPTPMDAIIKLSRKKESE